MKFSAARSELDSNVVEIELTLTSIVQGVALNFLFDAARAVLSFQQRVFWPYVLGAAQRESVEQDSVHHQRHDLRLGRVAPLFAAEQSPRVVCAGRFLRARRLAAVYL